MGIFKILHFHVSAAISTQLSLLGPHPHVPITRIKMQDLNWPRPVLLSGAQRLRWWAVGQRWSAAAASGWDFFNCLRAFALTVMGIVKRGADATHAPALAPCSSASHMLFLPLLLPLCGQPMSWGRMSPPCLPRGLRSPPLSSSTGSHPPRGF